MKWSHPENDRYCDRDRLSDCEPLAGQAGFNYCFQSDYMQERQWLAEGIRECCIYNPKINICLEYKPKEPRQHSHVARAADTIL